MTPVEVDALIARIAAKCARRRWYGTDEDFTPTVAEDPSTSFFHAMWLHDEGEQFAIQRQRFAQPPATEADLRATEEVLGVPFPPLLARLYLTLANGGFGPGTGLLGAPGALLLTPDPDFNGKYASFYIDGAHGSFHRDYGFVAAIPLWDWGCWIRSVFDPASGCVLRRYMDDVVEAASLQQWLDAWAGSDDATALWDVPYLSCPDDVLKQ